MPPEAFDVVHEVPGGVGLETRTGCRAAAAALVEQQHLVSGRIEQPPVVGAQAGARPAVQEHRGLGARRAAQLPVDAVVVADVEQPGVVRLDGWVHSPWPGLARHMDLPVGVPHAGAVATISLAAHLRRSSVAAIAVQVRALGRTCTRWVVMRVRFGYLAGRHRARCRQHGPVHGTDHVRCRH